MAPRLTTAPKVPVLRSEVFPGLWLGVPALLHRDPAALRQMVAGGTATAEHAVFVAARAL